MKLDKITIAMAVTAFLLGLAHIAVAAPAPSKYDNLVDPKTTKKKTAKKKVRRKKLSQMQSKPSAKSNKMVTAKSQKQAELAKQKQLAAAKRKEDQEIQNEIRALEAQAGAGYTPKTTAIPVEASASSTTATGQSAYKNTATPQTEVRAEMPADVVEEKMPYSGGVNLTYGNDNNVHPDRIDLEANFYMIEPKVSFNKYGFSANASAMIRDYADQEDSDMYKQNEARADLSYNHKFNEVFSSTSTIAGLYHDERWPDFINGPDFNGVDHGMPIRYFEATITQKVGFALGDFNLEPGLSYAHRDALSKYTDYSPDFLREKKFEKDYDEYTAFGRAAYAPVDFLEVALLPSVKQTKFSEREGRQADGHYGGLIFRAPLYELITSELKGELSFKFLGSVVTPFALVGQVSDEALGAEDQDYYGYGLNANIVLYAPLKLTLTPSILVKNLQFDNWRSDGYDNLRIPIDIPNGETREDDETTAGVTASIMATKNLGLAISYSMIKEESNNTATDENYKQEIISSTLVFAF